MKQVPEERAVRLLRREARLARLVGYLHPSARPDRAGALAFFVAAGKENLQRVRGDDFGAIVCPPGVPDAVMPTVSDGNTILFIASNFWAKGGDIALESFSEIQRLRPTAKLIVAGSSDPNPGISGVEWLGPVSRQELYEEVYPRADVFLYPTRIDCAPLVVMEALAHGIPVVAPRAFAIPEMIREGENGRLFSPGDHDEAVKHVLELLGDADLRPGSNVPLPRAIPGIGQLARSLRPIVLDLSRTALNNEGRCSLQLISMNGAGGTYDRTHED